MKEIIDTICRLLEQNESIVLTTIIQSEGSTPRAVGTKMIVRENGAFIGTIGGGLMESDVLQLAKAVFKSKHAAVHPFDMTNEAASEEGMVCGGHLNVLLEYLNADSKTRTAFYILNEALKKGEKCILVTDLTDLNHIPERPKHYLVSDDGLMHGEFPHPTAWIDNMLDDIARSRFAVLLPVENHLFFLESFLSPGVLCLFGAGHVSQPTAIQSLSLGFRCIVLDDRKAFANRERFPEPIEIRVLKDFKTAMTGLDIDENYYLVIVTRGHLYDKEVLAQALRTPAGYIGMIGSLKKRDTIYKALMDEGFSTSDIERVYCPIGMDIGAQTPEEIAISILGELIYVRSQKKI